MYQKSGTNMRNDAANVTFNIRALSRISVQIFQHTHGHFFTLKPTKTTIFDLHQFAHLPPAKS
ncbi:hypothetical protein BDQ17DRAFT_755830 [Cyathus striatus]|nr:hypothetical protein BDQ17DRAFT_755830 [Cyathus striatus]